MLYFNQRLYFFIIQVVDADEILILGNNLSTPFGLVGQ